MGAARCCLLLALLQPPFLPVPQPCGGSQHFGGLEAHPRWCLAGGSRLALPQGLSTRGWWALGAGRQHGPTVLVLSGASLGLWALVFEPEPGPSSSTQPRGGFCLHPRLGTPPALPSAAQDGKLAGGEEGELPVGRPQDPLPARPWTPSTAPAAGAQDSAPVPPLSHRWPLCARCCRCLPSLTPSGRSDLTA